MTQCLVRQNRFDCLVLNFVLVGTFLSVATELKRRQTWSSARSCVTHL